MYTATIPIVAAAEVGRFHGRGLSLELQHLQAWAPSHMPLAKTIARRTLQSTKMAANVADRDDEDLPSGLSVPMASTWILSTETAALRRQGSLVLQQLASLR